MTAFLTSSMAHEARSFDVKAGEAAKSLKLFAKQAKLGIVFDSRSLEDVYTEDVVGLMIPSDALARMLENTSLVFDQDDETGAFAVTRSEVLKEGSSSTSASDGIESQIVDDYLSGRGIANEPINPTQMNENKKRTGGLFKGLLGIAIAVSPNLDAQDDSSGDDEVYELSPFTIQADESEGYSATSTLAGTRLKTDLRDLGAAISVLTPQMFEDTGATDAETVLAYGLNTEISGAHGNFAQANVVRGVADTVENRRESHKANRVRGLAEATLTRGQFLTDIPFDGYNTSRVTINRGPNSLLFGIGSPGGVIDNGLKMASLGKDFGELSVRLGERGTHRETIDYNKVLVEDRLALRFAAMNEEIEYQQRPAFEEDQRIFLAFDAVLAKNENSGFLGRTSLRGSYENGEIVGTPVNIIPPGDGLMGWFQNDHLSRNMEKYTGVTLPGWVDDGSFVPRRTLDNFEIAKQFGGSVPGTKRYSLGGGMSFQTYWDWVPLIYDSPSTDVANQGLGGNYGDVAGVLGRWRAIGGTSVDNPQVEHWSNWPLGLHGSQLPGFNVPVMHPDVLDNRNVLLTGTTTSVEKEFDAHSLTLEQLFLDGNAGFEVTVDKQDYEVVDSFAITNQRWNIVWIDINETLGNGSPNPNVGRPMMIATRTNGVPENTNTTERESVKATGFFELDFQDRDNAMKWLGKHTFTGLLQSDTVDRTNLQSRLRWDLDPYSYLYNGSNFNSNWGPLPVWYVGPDLRNTSSYFDVRLDQPITGRLPQDGDKYQVITTKRIGPDYTTNPDGTRGDIYDMEVKRVTLAGNRTQQKLDSEALSWQSFFLDGHLTGLMGWRTDETYGYDRAGSARNSDGTWALSNQALAADPNPTVSGSTFTWGAVAHFPEDWLFELPSGADLSFHYNESENFSPLVGRKNLAGEEISAPTGSTLDYGFLVELMDRRLSIRVNWFELSSQFASFPAGFQRNSAQLPFTYEAAYREANVADADFDEFINRAVHPAEASDWFSSWDDLEAAARRALDSEYAALINPRYDPVGSDNDVSDPISGLTATTDFVSEGIEVDISGQITDAWRVTLNIGQQETIQTNTARDGIAMFGKTKEALIREKLWPIIFSPLGQDVTVGEHYDRLGTDVAAAQAKDGTVSQELREWRMNLITNYTIQDGKFKNFSVGGAARWQDDIAIGYPTTVTEGGAILPVIDSPYFGPTELNFDVWFSYRRQLNDKMDWKVQLNVRNAFGDDDYIPVLANPDGQVAVFRNPNPKEFFLTNTFSF